MNLAGNDTDADDGLDLTSITIVSGPTNGTITVNADGTVDYTHNGSETISDSFIYTIDDLAGATSNTVIVSLTITPVNDGPVANDDVFTVNEGSTTILDLAGNDIDTDDGLDLTSITIVSGPTNGTITVNADGTVDYTHDGSETVTDSFIYTIDDLSGVSSNTGIMSLTITPVNDAPIAANDSLTATQDTALVINPASDLLGNDSDVEGNPLTITSFTQPANGTVVDNGDGTWTYTPNSNFYGNDSFTYTVDDGNGGAATATLNLSVIFQPNSSNNTIAKTQSSNDTTESTTINTVISDTQSSPQRSDERFSEQQDAYETTTARDVFALLSVLNPVHVLSQIDVIDEDSDIYGADRLTNNDTQYGLSNVLINNELLWQELDQLRNTINDSNDEDGTLRGNFSDIIISLGSLSVTSGLIAWLLRGGSLAASFISAMPLWTGMDPLPVLNKSKKDEEDEGHDATNISADKRVERLIKGESAHW